MKFLLRCGFVEGQFSAHHFCEAISWIITLHLPLCGGLLMMTENVGAICRTRLNSKNYL